MKYILFTCLLFSSTLSNAQILKGIIQKATKIVSDVKPGLNQEDIANGLKEALTVGTEKGCVKLSKPDAFFKNAALKILMPPEAQKMENTIRKLGLNNLADDFILSMNRAAEDACTTASPIFIKAIKEMTITDGISILKGTDTAATYYLKSKTQNDLKASFSPIIKKSLDKVEATKNWEKLITTYNKIPFVNKKMNPNLTDYVTEKAILGIYSEIASQEKEIRANPLARTTALLKLVFEKK
jgi:hypothetical protein